MIRTPKRIPVYRPDIDGLRAIAILAVIAYHAFPDAIKGGFIGVDIFFVISGFLITGIISREIQLGSFSLGGFYARRIRRIFPALCITLSVLLVFGILFLLPNELESLAAQSLASAGFVANFYFWLTSDYFSTASEQLALLHLWTLGLEEQYYLIWPIALIVMIYLPFKPRHLVALALLLSFAINIKYYRWNPEWTFFLPPARFWELFAGSALALSVAISAPVQHGKNLVKEVVAIASLVVLVASLFLIVETGFPGWQALAPVGATVMLIWTGQKTVVSRYILSNRLMIGIGLISYPLYLYHWPLLVFFKTIVFQQYPNLSVALAILFSFTAAVVTYLYIEIPIRRSRSRRSLVLLVSSAIAVALVALLILFGYITGRINSAEVAMVSEATADWSIPRDNYRKLDDFELLELSREKENVVVIGDSHASQYHSFFIKNLDKFSSEGLGVQFATYGGCPPIPEANRLESGYGCPQFYRFALNYARSEAVKAVVIVAWWEHYFGYRFGVSDAREMLDIDLGSFEVTANKLGDELEGLVQSGKRVVVILSNPTSPGFDPDNMVSRLNGGLEPKAISRSEFLKFTNPVTRILRRTLDNRGITIVDPTEYLCKNDACPGVDSSARPIYKDSHHLRSSFVGDGANFLFESLGISED